MLPWKSIIKINKSLNRPIYLQIADAIISEVNLGHIRSGTRLPSSRELAKRLTLNRKTVLLAYDELIAQGWVDIVPSKGTYVKDSLPVIHAAPLSRNIIVQKTIVEADKALPVLRRINDGTPDYRLAPIDKLYSQVKSVTKGALGKSVLLGDHAYGEITLRKVLVDYLADTRAISGSIDNILVTRGSQMSIFLTFSTLLDNGDAVIVGNLNYRSANEAIITTGGRLLEVPVNNEGLCLNAIEKILAKQRVKAIYLTPHHHYPTTVTMPVENRLQLLKLASKHNFFIVEDDYDYDYHYNRSPILPMASIDNEKRVIYIGTFSKLLAPSIRIGYMHATKEMIDKCASLRRNIDVRGDPPIERALSILLKENEIQRSLKKTISIYKTRRDILCKVLKSELSDSIQFSVPNGGMAIWVKLMTTTLEKLKIMTEKNGLTLAVDGYHIPDSFRIGFASMNEKELIENTATLIESIKRIND